MQLKQSLKILSGLGILFCAHIACATSITYSQPNASSVYTDPVCTDGSGTECVTFDVMNGTRARILYFHYPTSDSTTDKTWTIYAYTSVRFTLPVNSQVYGLHNYQTWGSERTVDSSWISTSTQPQILVYYLSCAADTGSTEFINHLESTIDDANALLNETSTEGSTGCSDVEFPNMFNEL